ncbi:MAG: M42 family metallopeptidase [Clostridiales bacterium]|nr:M42 family metallopeptidase [Clostridiales bacterium]
MKNKPDTDAGSIAEITSLITALTAVPAISGYERAAHAAARAALDESLFTEIYTDSRGNLILIRRCGKEGAPLVLIDAHFDEIGFLVTEICDGGFVRLNPVGGFDPGTLSAAELTIHCNTPEGEGKPSSIPAVIVSTPPHLSSGETKAPDLTKLIADTGKTGDELNSLIRIGAMCTLRAPVTKLLGGIIAGHAFDDRCCCAAAVTAVKYLAALPEAGADVAVVFSAGEEISGDGVSSAAYGLQPDIALVLDVNFGRAPYVDGHVSAVPGEGPSISISAVTDRRLTDFLTAYGAENGMPLQRIVEPTSTGTNNDRLRISAEGYCTAILSIPLRNMHTASELINPSDADTLARLIAGFIAAEKGGLGDFLTGALPDMSAVYAKPDDKDKDKDKDKEKDDIDKDEDKKDAADTASFPPRPLRSGLSGTELIGELSETFGPTGCEQPVRRLIEANLPDPSALPFGKYETDLSGNLLVTFGGKPSDGCDKCRDSVDMMFAAHMDEVGFMITHIDGDGMLRFSCVGGIDPRVLPGRRVTLGGSCGDKSLPGVIATKPVHLKSQSERGNVTEISAMYIDIGAKNREDAEKYVRPGDYGTFDSEFYRMGDKLKGKALDDRFGCAVMIDILNELARGEIPAPERRIAFAFTVREEIGRSGAAPAAFRLDPKCAVVLETTAIGDILDAPEHLRVAECGKGGVISVADKGTIYSEDFIAHALALAKAKDIPVQIKQRISGGNDAARISISRRGVVPLALSAPTRYLHSASNVLAERDFGSIKALVRELMAVPFDIIADL